MKQKTFKTMMLAFVTLFATSAAMVFTSCGDDKDEPDSQSLIGQWEVTNVKDVYGTGYSRMAAEFKKDGTYNIYSFDDVYEKWYVSFTAEWTADPIDSKTHKGVFHYNNGGHTGVATYWFEGKQLVIKEGEKTYWYKRTSGIKPEAHYN